MPLPWLDSTRPQLAGFFGKMSASRDARAVVLAGKRWSVCAGAGSVRQFPLASDAAHPGSVRFVQVDPAAETSH